MRGRLAPDVRRGIFPRSISTAAIRPCEPLGNKTKRREVTTMRQSACLSVLTALIAAAVVQVAHVRAQTRSMPVFELDGTWPKVSPEALADPSSIGIDAQDNIWVLQRPRTRKSEQAKTIIHTILVFDAQ